MNTIRDNNIHSDIFTWRKSINVSVGNYALSDFSDTHRISSVCWSCVSLVWYFSWRKIWFVTHVFTPANWKDIFEKLRNEIKVKYWLSLENFRLLISWWNKVFKVVNPKQIISMSNIAFVTWEVKRQIDFQVHLNWESWNRVTLNLENWEVVSEDYLMNKNEKVQL
mgnify:CR=1 FL=1